MKSARFRLQPVSPWATAWQADSLFGALAWELARTAGDEALSRVLQGFRKGPPPFVISDAFPADLLPMPLSVAGTNARAYPALITREQFGAVRHGEAPAGDIARQEWFRSIRTSHAMIPRDGGAPVGFHDDECWWHDDVPADQRYLSLYVRCEPEWQDRLAALLRSLGRSGFGRRSSTGRGAFELLGAAESCEWLDPLPFENAFVTLSHFVPDETDPADGWWDTQVKFPKLGSERGASSSPTKGRLVLLRPGSCFRPMGRPRRWYGRMLAGLSPAFPDALHYGLAYAVGIRWN